MKKFLFIALLFLTGCLTESIRQIHEALKYLETSKERY